MNGPRPGPPRPAGTSRMASSSCRPQVRLGVQVHPARQDRLDPRHRPASRPLAALALTLQMGWRKLIYFQFFAKCIASDQASPPLQMEHCRVIMPPRQGVRSELGDQQNPALVLLSPKDPCHFSWSIRDKTPKSQGTIINTKGDQLHRRIAFCTLVLSFEAGREAKGGPSASRSRRRTDHLKDAEGDIVGLI